MDILNDSIVTDADTEILDGEIDQISNYLSKTHYFDHEQEEELELLVAKAMKLGELYERKKWQAAKALAVPQWISVKDELPPANILVLGMSQTPRNIFNIYNVMALDEFEEADATHWMPLPAAPKIQEAT